MTRGTQGPTLLKSLFNFSRAIFASDSVVVELLQNLHFFDDEKERKMMVHEAGIPWAALGPQRRSFMGNI